MQVFSMANLIRLMLLVVIVTASLGCNRDDGEGVLLRFTPRQLQINAGLDPTFGHFFEIPAVSTEHARFQRETGTGWDDWQAVLPARATLTILEAGLDWSFAEEVIIRAYSDDFPTPVEIYYRDQIPFNVGQQLELIPADRDVKALLASDNVNLVLVLFRLRSTTVQRLPVTMEFSVEARN